MLMRHRDARDKLYKSDAPTDSLECRLGMVEGWQEGYEV